MSKNAFLFDIICPRIQTNNKSLNAGALTVDVKFHNIHTEITSNQINVVDFKEPGLQFLVDFQELKYMVTVIPIIFKVKRNNKVIGIGKTSWPYSALSQIHSAMTEIFNAGQCNLNLKGMKVGTLDFAMRIRKKKKKYQSKLPVPNSNVKEANNDILNRGKMANQTKKICEKTPKTVVNNSIPDHKTNNMFQDVVKKSGSDKEEHKARPLKYPERERGGCDRPTSYSKSEKQPEAQNEVKDMNDSSHWFWPDGLNPKAPSNQTVLQPPKCCIVCKEDISWLPVYSACPTCGYQTMPQEVKYNNELTAKQIMEEYTNKKCMDETCDPVRKSKSISSFCKKKRKKLLEDLKIEMGSKQQATNKKRPKLYQCPTMEDSSDCRPILKTILSELRIIYKKADELETPVKSCGEKQKMKSAYGKQSRSESKKESSRCEGNVKSAVPETNVKRPSVIKGHHKNCVQQDKKIPKNMGWLWTKDPRPNWRPGIIDKRIRKIMHYFQDIHPATSAEAKRQVSKKIKKICDEHKIIPSTLRIRKKADAYTITLNPQTNPDSIQGNKGKPITFKIVKHPKLILYKNLKQKMKGMGFAKCVCHRPISDCICRSFLEKKHLEFAVKKECCALQIPCVNNDLVLSKTSISEADLDFEVTTPAQVMKSKQKKVVMLNSSSQYIKQDYELSEEKPQPINPFLASYDCTVGEKYGKPPFIPQPGQIIPGMEWKEALLAEKRAKARALRAEKNRLLNKPRLPKKKKVQPPWGEKGPPGGFAPDGTPLDENGLPYCDAEGYYLDANGNRTGKRKRKPVNMIKYLSKQGLFKGKDLNPEYLAKMRRLRQEYLRKLSERPPDLLCTVDRLGKPYSPCQYCFGQRVC